MSNKDYSNNDLEKSMETREVVDKLSRTFSILGDPNRTRIIYALSRSELCVAEIAESLHMSNSAISHQLRALKDLDLVAYRKEGRRAFYRLSDEHIENLIQEGLRHVMERI